MKDETDISKSESFGQMKTERIDNEESNKTATENRALLAHLRKLLKTNKFMLKILLAIGLAFAAPGVGLALAPKITASYIVVCFIFLLTGLNLKTNELVSALVNMKFNATIQLYNLGIIPIFAWLIANALRGINALDKDLANGIIVCACLPMTINMVIVLTKSANGDEAAAVFNAAFGNLLGVFVTPLWVLGLIGKSASVDFLHVIIRIVQRVLIPLFVGQVAQYKIPSIRAFVNKHIGKFKAMQEYCLAFIVYCAFCAVARDRRRKNSNKQGPVKIIVTILIQVAILFIAMIGAWTLLKFLFQNQPRLRVMGLFGSCQKTVALGVPLIDAIFSDASRSQIGILLLPLLIYHPAQLIVHSALSPRLAAWVIAEEGKLGGLRQTLPSLEEDDDIEQNATTSSQRIADHEQVDDTSRGGCDANTPSSSPPPDW